MHNKYMTANATRLLIALLLLIAVVERFAWAIKRGWHSSAGEATNVALALANGRGFADPYFVGSGPTAHLMPTTPAFAGAVYWLLGPGSTTAEIVLQTIASAEMVGGYLLLFVLFRRLGASSAARIAALAVICIVPTFMGQESLDFRYWEGALAVILAVTSLILIVDLDGQAATPGRGQVIAQAGLFAATFFTSPSLGIAVGACSLVLLLRKPRWQGRIAMGAVACLFVAILLAPWVIRNELVLGKPILLRSNMGLELSIANGDRQVDLPHHEAFNSAMGELHPSNEGPGRLRLTQVGEIRYMAELSTRTQRWIADHPGEFVALCLRHLRQMLFPEAWQFEIGAGSFSGLRAAICSLAALFGLLGFGLGLKRGQRGYLYVALTVAIVCMTYVPFQPMARYIYLTFGLLLFASFDGISRGLAMIAARPHNRAIFSAPD